MKYLYSILVLANICSCQTNEKIINVREYLYPNLQNGEMRMYEYESSSKEPFYLTYMLIERDTNQSKTYKYTFLNSELSILSAYVETRHPKHIDLKKMLLPEINENYEQTLQEVNITDMELPIELEINKTFKIPIEWESTTQKNVKYKQESTRKLISENSSIDHLGNDIKTIKIQSNDYYEISNSLNIYKNVSESIMIAEYGQGIGLLKFETTFENGITYNAELKSIYNTKETELLKQRINKPK